MNTITINSNIKKRIVWLDYLKGVLILLVVLGHVINTVHVKLQEPFLNDFLWNFIYSFHMPAFMAISGFLAYRKGTGGGKSRKWTFIVWRRFRQLMIPYILWSIALLFTVRNVEHYFEYFLFPHKSFWFLWALFFISAIFTGTEIMSEKIKCKLEYIVVIPWFILLAIMFSMANPKLFCIEYITYYFFYYAIGYFINKYSDKLLIKNTWLIVILGVIWIVLASIYNAEELPQELYFLNFLPTTIVYYIYRIGTALFAILFLFSMGNKFIRKVDGINTIFLKLGTVSLGIYTIHKVFYFLLIDEIFILFPGITYWPFMLIAFLLTIIISYMVVWLLQKNKYTAILLLGKV